MLKRIAVVGPESTGKTTLAEKLGKHYNTLWVPEYAREYLDIINRPYTINDLEIIAKGQLQEEDRKAERANKLLVCDTNLVVIKVWSLFKYNQCSSAIDDMMVARKYDIHLLMDIDFPWMADPQREHPNKRKELFALYKQVLDELEVPYHIISGKSAQRFQRAVEVIDEVLAQ